MTMTIAERRLKFVSELTRAVQGARSRVHGSG